VGRGGGGEAERVGKRGDVSGVPQGKQARISAFGAGDWKTGPSARQHETEAHD